VSTPESPRRSYHYEVEARSAAACDAVFATLSDAVRWKDWAGPMINRSGWDRLGEPAPGGVGAVRSVGRFPVLAKEEVVVWDPPHHHAYVLRSGLPTRSYRADVTLTEDGGGTRIHWTGTFVPSIPGSGVLLRWFIIRTMRAMAGRLAMASTTHPSPTS
jgi:hypothetical protein